MSVTMTSVSNDRPLRLGFLLGPLGWLNERLASLSARYHLYRRPQRVGQIQRG